MPLERKAHFQGRGQPPGCQSLSWSNLSIGASFFPMEKNQHRPGDCSGRGFATQIEARGLENELPVYTARRFPKNTQVGLCTEKGCPTAPRKRPRVRQRISKETPNQRKVPPGVPREADGHPASPKHPKGHPRRPFCLQNISSDILLPPIWNMF